jgi:hypothetical protein
MIGLFLAAQLAVATPAAQIAPGTYTFSATMNGAKVGTSTVTVKSDGTTTELDEQATGSISGQSASANATLILGADLSPTTYQLSATNDGSPLKDSATVANTTANITNVHGQKASIDLLASTKHFVVLDFGVFSGFLSLPAQMRAWNNGAVLAVVPALGQSVTLVPDTNAQAKRPATVPNADQSLVFEGQTPFTIWYNPTTNVPDEIDVTAQGISVVRLP